MEGFRFGGRKISNPVFDIFLTELSLSLDEQARMIMSLLLLKMCLMQIILPKRYCLLQYEMISHDCDIVVGEMCMC